LLAPGGSWSFHAAESQRGESARAFPGRQRAPPGPHVRAALL